MYRAGPHMVAIISMAETIYTCNNENRPRIMKEIASIYGPFRIWDCKHIRSLSFSWLHAYFVLFVTKVRAYLVPFLKIIASICGPALNPRFIMGYHIFLLVLFEISTISNLIWFDPKSFCAVQCGPLYSAMPAFIVILTQWLFRYNRREWYFWKCNGWDLGQIELWSNCSK